jgi:superoxide dismutase
VVAREARTFMLTDEQGIPPDLTPLLVLDLVEHSYWGEYPGRKDLYVAAWLRNLDWGWVEQANLPAGV